MPQPLPIAEMKRSAARTLLVKIALLSPCWTSNAAGGEIEIGILQHDDRVVATELQQRATEALGYARAELANSSVAATATVHSDSFMVVSFAGSTS